MAYQYYGKYDVTPADNSSPAPNGAPEGMPPGDVNDALRQSMAASQESYTGWDQLLSQYPDNSDPPVLPPNLGANDGAGTPVYYSIAYLEVPNQTFTVPQTINGDGSADPVLSIEADTGADIQFKHDGNEFLAGWNGTTGKFVMSGGTTAPVGSFVVDGAVGDIEAGNAFAFTRRFEPTLPTAVSYFGVQSSPTAGAGADAENIAAQLVSVHDPDEVANSYAGLVATMANTALDSMPWQGYWLHRPAGTANNVKLLNKNHWHANVPAYFAAGLTLVGGMSCGSAASGAATDLSKHIALYGENYGFSVTGSALNLVAAGTAYNFTSGGATIPGTLTVNGTSTLKAVTGTSGTFTSNVKTLLDFIVDTDSGGYTIFRTSNGVTTRGYVGWNGTANGMLINDSYHSNRQLYSYAAMGSWSGWRFDSNGPVGLGLGQRGRDGQNGSWQGQAFNLWWDSPYAELWVDSTNLGRIDTSPVSDERAKNVSTEDYDGLAVINSLSLKKWRWKDIPEDTEAGYMGQKDDGYDHYGVTAQDLLQVFPQAVMGKEDEYYQEPAEFDEEGETTAWKDSTRPKFMQVRDKEFTGLLLKAVQQLSERVEALENA